MPLYLQEGPHCLITEDEFYDAVDATLDKLEKEEEKVIVLIHTFVKEDIFFNATLFFMVDSIIEHTLEIRIWVITYFESMSF